MLIVRLIQVHANKVAFIIKIRLFYKLFVISIFDAIFSFFHFYKIIFFTFRVFLYIIMYILNITKAMKTMSVNKLNTISLKTIIKELYFLRKAVIIQ